MKRIQCVNPLPREHCLVPWNPGVVVLHLQQQHAVPQEKWEGWGGGSGERRRIFLGSYSGSSSAATQARRDPRIPEEEVDRLVGRLSELQGRASPSSPAPAQPFPT